ncbi:hypothetical protein ACCT19_34885, partial [Rhizobium ruizarguesonis]
DGPNLVGTRCNSFLSPAVNSRLELTGLPPIIFEQYYSPELRVVLRSVRLGPSNQPLSELRFDRFQIGWGN